MKWTIKNKIETKTSLLTIGQLITMFVTGKLISIPEFLQRTLLKSKWFAEENKNSKEYIVSLFKGQGQLDSFTIVRLDLLIHKIQEAIDAEPDKKLAKSLKDGKKTLEKYKANEGEYAILDGQSRIKLGIVPYCVENSFSLGESSKNLNLFEDDKPKINLLSTKKFNELPIEVQALLKNQEVVVNFIINFNSFNDVVDALVNKQKGFKWLYFQIQKQKHRFTKFTSSLVDMFSDDQKIGEDVSRKFVKFWTNNVKQTTDKFKLEVDGHQYMSIIGGYMFDKKSYPTEEEIVEQMSKTNPIDTKNIIKFHKFVDEKLSTYIGDYKMHLSAFLNYIVFRMILDNGKKNSDKPFLKPLILTNNIHVKKESELYNEFWKLHLKLISSKTHHEASYTKVNGKWDKFNTGYAYLCGKQSTSNIVDRMIIFMNYMDLGELEKQKIIKYVENTTMPSKEEVAVDNDFKDVEGTEIKSSDLANLDRSHYDSVHNNGTNELQNLGLENYSSNRSRGSKNLEKVSA